MSSSEEPALDTLPPARRGRAHVGGGGDEDRRLYRLMLWGFVTLFPLGVMFIVTAVVAHSAAMIVCSVLVAISITVQSFSIYALRQVLRRDTFSFPYGAGKLENFSAFLCGVLFVPSGLYMAFDAALRLGHPGGVRYLVGLVPVMLSAVRVGTLYLAARRLAAQTEAPSPVLRAYLLDYRISLLNDLGIIVAFAAGWALGHVSASALGQRIDPAIALAISLYMVWSGVGLVRRNFRALVDLPLPEAEQLRLLKVLARHYAEYETIGTVFSRTSGRQRIVEVELVFSPQAKLEDLEHLGAVMEQELAGEVPGLAFRLIPVVRRPAAVTSASKERSASSANTTPQRMQR